MVEITRGDVKKNAVKFIVLMGVVSLFADMTYEGARSISGPFMALLGASATVVGVVSGIGELIGYTLRLVSGYITDKTRQYWFITILGYIINLVAVPLMALAGKWEVAAFLIITERFGKAIRSPAKDTIISSATKQIGTGFGFGLHEALDQIGALTGPIIISIVMLASGNLRTGFALLGVPALLAIATVVTAKVLYKNPLEFEPKVLSIQPKGMTKGFWIYVIAVSAIAAGYADFPLIAFHFKKEAILVGAWIPFAYSIAMGVDALAALLFGKLFDRYGISILVLTSFISAFFAPLVFLGGFGAALLGMAFWGIGMGAQESIMRAVISEMISREKRGSAYGILNMSYGVFWFLGSALMGMLYDKAIMLVIVFSVVAQLVSVPLLVWIRVKRL